MMEQYQAYDLIRPYAVSFVPDGERQILHAIPLPVAVKLFGKKAVDYVRVKCPKGFSTWTYGREWEELLNVYGVILAVSYNNIQEMKAAQRAAKQAERMQRAGGAPVILFSQRKTEMERAGMDAGKWREIVEKETAAR